MKKLLLIPFSLLLSIFLLESFVRVLPLLPVTSMGAVLRRDSVMDHSLRPGAVGRMKSREFDVVYRINSAGLRDDELSGDEKILILGDSFMEGYGVSRGEMLPDLLEAKGVRVANAGVKSYSPLLEYLFLRHKGLALRPDTVLLFLDLSDPANDEYYGRRLIRDSEGKPLSIEPRHLRFPEPPPAIADWLESHSVLYCHALHLAFKWFADSSEDIGYAGAGQAEKLLFAARDSVSDTAYYPAWNPCLENIRLIRDMLKARNIGFVLITYPYAHQVSEKAWATGRKAHKFPEGISSDRPFRLIESFAASESIPLISLYPAFRNHPEPEKLFFEYDGHWTPEGHRLAAETVYGTTLSLNLMSPRPGPLGVSEVKE